MTSAQAAQSETKQRITSQDYAAFDRLVGDGQTSKTEVTSQNGHCASPHDDKEAIESNTNSVQTEKVESPRVQVSTDSLPGVPSTSYQFQADYVRLKNQPVQFYQYFKVRLHACS